MYSSGEEGLDQDAAAIEAARKVVQHSGADTVSIFRTASVRSTLQLHRDDIGTSVASTSAVHGATRS